MPFSVEHKGILDVEGPANKGATKDVQSNIFGDKVVVRGRLSFARHTSKNHAEHLKSIESCGCDTPYNKPYRPLGSMDSVLNLRIKKIKTWQKPASLKGHGHLANAATHLKSLVASPEVAADQREQDEGERDGLEFDDRPLSAKIAFVRASTKGREATACSYQAIKAAVHMANKRLRRVKGGTAFSTVVQNHEPLDAAMYASVNDSREVSCAQESRMRNRTTTRRSTFLSIELPDEIQQERLTAVATLKHELDKLETKLNPTNSSTKPHKPTSHDRQRRSSRLEREDPKSKRRLRNDIQSEKGSARNTGEQSSKAKHSMEVNDKRDDRSSNRRVPAYMYYSSTNNAKIKERIEAIRREIQPKGNEGSEGMAPERRGRRKKTRKDTVSSVETRTQAMANKVFAASKKVLAVQAEASEKLCHKFKQNDFERPLSAKYKFRACARHFSMQPIDVSSANCSTLTTEKGLQRLRDTADEIRKAELVENMAKHSWFDQLIQITEETFGDVSSVQEKFLRALRQVIVEGHDFDQGLFKQLLLQGFSKAELRSAELQHVVSYVREKVLQMDAAEYRNFLVLHKLPVPSELANSALPTSQTSADIGQRQTCRTARFQVGASMKAAAAIAKFKNRYKKKRRAKRGENKTHADILPGSLSHSTSP